MCDYDPPVNEQTRSGPNGNAMAPTPNYRAHGQVARAWPRHPLGSDQFLVFNFFATDTLRINRARDRFSRPFGAPTDPTKHELVPGGALRRPLSGARYVRC